MVEEGDANTGIIVMYVLTIVILVVVLLCFITNNSSNKEFVKYGHIEKQRENYLLYNRNPIV